MSFFCKSVFKVVISFVVDFLVLKLSEILFRKKPLNDLVPTTITSVVDEVLKLGLKLWVNQNLYSLITNSQTKVEMLIFLFTI